jgi:hypothetical protein
MKIAIAGGEELCLQSMWVKWELLPHRYEETDASLHYSSYA